ncbi:hypothetical protein J7T55_008116 [Diaporthe amygdali]|uniref:uncharacterized protein n=1 Tax=Phomopsis amygdali TaxID=1214568 RepID=UPI0022FE9D83|nr:uncharacterized protein J7T55_008116 [Diaporthe amygdali]KAJ0107980.1 hypothetical protein J7T55_008116 [Diaporthe amygdali]
MAMRTMRQPSQPQEDGEDQGDDVDEDARQEQEQELELEPEQGQEQDRLWNRGGGVGGYIDLHGQTRRAGRYQAYISLTYTKDR